MNQSVWIVIGMVLFGTVFWLFYISRPAYKQFKEAILYDVLWKWQWKGQSIIGLWCYCPDCGGDLVCDDENCKTTSNLNEKTTFFICNGCGGHEKGRIKGGDRRYAITVVRRELRRRVSSGEFLKTLTKK